MIRQNLFTFWFFLIGGGLSLGEFLIRCIFTFTFTFTITVTVTVTGTVTVTVTVTISVTYEIWL